MVPVHESYRTGLLRRCDRLCADLCQLEGTGEGGSVGLSRFLIQVLPLLVRWTYRLAAWKEDPPLDLDDEPQLQRTGRFLNFVPRFSHRPDVFVTSQPFLAREDISTRSFARDSSSRQLVPERTLIVSRRLPRSCGRTSFPNEMYRLPRQWRNPTNHGFLGKRIRAFRFVVTS